MTQVYGHNKPVRRHHPAYKVHLMAVCLIFVALLLSGGLYFRDLKSDQRQGKPTSAVKNTFITGDQKTFKNQDFVFKDSQNWIFIAKESNANKYTYYQYQGQQIEHQLVVYVNQVPISLYLAASRVLPVRLVNQDSLEPLNVSQHCGKTYGPGELHNIKDVVIDEAVMLCDPDTPQYTVVASEVADDYRLNLKKPDGTPIQFVITYKNQKREPNGETIKNIAASFKAI